MSSDVSEFVIPSGQLSDMENGTISALTFYLKTSASAAWTATFQVYLKEIDATTLTGLTGPSTSTVVYTGTLDATGTEMTVTFSTPYTYNGGDLLIGTYVSVKSTNYPQASFYGVSQSVNTACYKKGLNTTSQQFIPKTTFTYTPSNSVVTPNNLAVSDVTATTATVSWNGNGDSYTVKYTKLFLSEGFEGGMPTGWTSEGDASWSVGTGDYSTSTGSHSGDYNAKITHTTKNNVTYLITPSMDLSGETSLKLSFWYINRAAVSHIDGIGVYYRVGTEGAWNELWSTTEAHGSWTNQEVTLTGLAADYQLGFKMTNNNGYGVGLDDIQITTSAGWQTINDITIKSTTLTGLDANTTYGCQVQSVKAGNTSLWSPIATFTTTENIATLTEDNPIAPLTAMNGKQTKVRFERSGLTAGKYSTICLPYDFTPSETCTFYTFKGVTNENNVWIADISEYTGTLTANTPYIFTTESATSVTFFNDAVNAAASYSDASANTIATNDADWTFQGTYSAISLPKAGEYDYGFAAGDGSEIEIGTFVHLVSGASAAPFRAYLKYTGSDVNWAKAPNRSGATNGDALPQRIIVRVVGSNGQTTAIGTIDTKTGDVTFDSNEWYSLDGLKLNGAPSNSGIYIKDGKKIIVK